MSREDFQRAYGIIGVSGELSDLIDIAIQVAPTNLSVLITGESGTGKEIFARAIHGAGSRSSGPFIAVNCGAIPETLLESELFGHEKGSFTGATESRKGLFEQADGGTIFLDEIGEMPVATQVKLLRVLETGEITPVGSRGSRHTDVRVIAATNRDLEYEVHRGEFRQDLYFRLRAVQIHLPPLRERTEDIPLLVNAIAAEVAQRNQIRFAGFTSDAIARLQVHHWSGNIRELRNVIETAIVLEKGSKISASMIERYLGPDVRAGLPMPLAGKSTDTSERELVIRALLELRNDIGALRELVEDIARGRVVHTPQVVSPSASELSIASAERTMIAEALRRHRYNKRRAAAELGISERTLYRKIISYRLLDDDEHETPSNPPRTGEISKGR